MADSVTKCFQQRIEAWLKTEMEKDPQFAEVVRSNPKKTVQGACNYVLKCAKESKQCGYDDDEVYGMVRHFFDEGDITDPGDQNPSRIVVSGHIDLSESEKAEAMANAERQYLKEIREREAIREAEEKEKAKRDAEQRRKRLEEQRAQERQMDLFAGM